MRRMRRWWRLVAVALLAGLLLVRCNDGDPSWTGTPAPAILPDFWRGI